MRTLRILFVTLMLLTAILFAPRLQSEPQTAETPRVENAKVETRVLTATLDATFRGLLAQADKPEWIGYNVAEVAGDHSVCCGNYRDGAGCGTCNLEKEHEGFPGTTRPDGTVKLEGARQLVVLFRLDAKQVMRIRVASDDCTLDAGGLPFVWLTGVKSAESVALLQAFVHSADFESQGDHGIGNGALTAIALHADTSADRAFESFVTPDHLLQKTQCQVSGVQVSSI